ncbi:Asp-tRNA(Asn)/Glu-tRNA(Gln) amidotransferase subunit GatA [candidate division KSB1 bacterium]|nr:Asp-tRNA(Asn)/Glu-tRNA(Gln) amidotransferase subunit GatA [candidate division KSB1 bacterium]
MTLAFETADFQQLRPLLDNKTVDCVTLVDSYLKRIRQHQRLNAFISVFDDRARQAAAAIDLKIKTGDAGKLAGLVIAIKDLICIKNERTTCGSKILSNFIPPYDAFVIKRLLAEDAILIGKTNMDEFGMGSSTENSHFGAALNPHDMARVPGGSSGGSAVAVADGQCTASLGTDTGGSIRQPASFCGVVGLKPTYGRVSRFGLVAYASSLDQIGPITRSVPDAAMLLQVIAGHDRRDSTSASLPVPDYSSGMKNGVSGLKVGVPREYISESVQLEVSAAIERTIDSLRQGGASIEQTSLPHSKYAIATYYIIATAEASSNLARYDGTRFGYRAGDADDLESMYVKTRSQGFGEEVKRRIMLGTYVLSAGYYDAYYRKAQKVRTLIKQDFDRAFEKFDVLIAPTAPTTAFGLGEKLDDPLTMYLSDIFTVSINLAGVPAISIPVGYDSNKLPIGAQVIAKAYNEATLFHVGYFLEQESSAKMSDSN